MDTKCPECSSICRVAEAQLAAAQGKVRFTHCAVVFDALRTLAEQLPPEPIEALAAHPRADAPPPLELPVFRPNPVQVPLLAEPDERRRPLSHERTSSPTFAARRQRARRQRGNAGWLAGCALLLVTLGAEIAWADRDRWIDDARVRSWLDLLCSRVGCTLPLRREPSRLELSSRDIRPHPSVNGALIISATLRNDAPFAQAWPVVAITLSDFDGQPVAMRRFLPREYLAEPAAAGTGIAAGASSSLVFEVADPGRNAVAFEFGFE